MAQHGQIHPDLQQAISLGAAGDFAAMLPICHRLAAETADVNALASIGALLFGHGFLSEARACFERLHTLSPNDLRPLLNLAHVASDSGDHAAASGWYDELTRRFPDHAAVRRGALLSREYDPHASNAERLALARSWGDWAIARAGGPMARPAPADLAGRPLRIGYVSADFCQHTVGLFVKDVIRAHDSQRVQVTAYGAGQVSDWVTRQIAASCTLRDVSQLSDAALVQQIQADRIDLLVDLSGHTAGSRLSAFARRPAAVMVSWLGYFATTGLPYIDAVFLDRWHAPAASDAQFVEPLIRLASGRLCYRPVPWARELPGSPPAMRNGYLTFGCFNNTAKYNAEVFDLWAQILHRVPESRLVLKWRTFNDAGLRRQVHTQFEQRGVKSDRIELRGPSFHKDLLKQYAEIDIALDPFPFTGGLTSCEALWMGVPVITWPQDRVVSRQTSAILHQIGLPHLVADDAAHYLQIAVELASRTEELATLRRTLRGKMRASSLMDVAAFTRGLESAYLDLHQRVRQG